MDEENAKILSEYEKLETVQKLNAVEGFDPLQFLISLDTDNPAIKKFYLEVKYRILWFRLLYPDGKIVKKIMKLDERMAVVEARIYTDCRSEEGSFLANGFGQRFYNENDSYGIRYLETAETAAIGRALHSAGFNLYCTDSEDEKEPVETPITKKVEEKPAFDLQNCDRSAPAEELERQLNLKLAKEIVIAEGKYRGKSLGEIYLKAPQIIEWFAVKYKGSDNLVRAGARVLYQAIQKQSANATAAG